MKDSITYTGLAGYIPSQPKIGRGVPDSVFAGENAIKETWGWRTYGGSADQSETRAASAPVYTISLVSGQAEAICSSGATCKADFRVKQHVVIARKLYLIEAIPADDRLRLAPTPDVTISGQTINKVPVLSPVNADRITLTAGNAVGYRNAAIFAIGDGSLYKNGAALSPPLTATTALMVAYPLPAGGYDSRPAGFTTPAKPTVASGAAGTKNQPTGSYWIAVARKRKGFRGYGTFSERANLTIAVAGNKLQVTLGAFATSEGQDAWVVAVNRISERTQERPDLWLVQEYDVQSTAVEFDFFDDELLEKATYDNDAPPAAQYVFTLGGYLGVAGCGGPPDSSGIETTPGSEIAAAKASNPEAFSPFARTPTDLGEIVVGIQTGELVAFVQTPNTMQVLSLTGSTINPFAIRAAWFNGFAHQFSGVVAGEMFYGLTDQGLYRTLGKDNYAPDDSFAAKVKSDFANLVRERVFLGFDPINKLVVVFWSNAQQGAGSGWQTLAWSFNVEQGHWNTPVVMGDGTTDFTVTSCASVGGKLLFATSDGKTYRWDFGGATQAGYLAFPFAEDASQHLKTVRRVKLIGNANGKLRLYKNLDVTGLRSGASAAEKTLTQGGTGQSVEHTIWQPVVQGTSFALRVDFSLPGRAPVFDQADVEFAQHGGFVK